MSARPAFVLDLNRCTGCRACELACQIANALPAGRDWRRVRTHNPLLVGGLMNVHLSLACNHCEDPPCATQCPARAYYRDEVSGALLIDADACLGCRYCAWVCPYDAPRFDEAAGVMTKCTFCNDRQREGEAPACVDGCPTGALAWADLREEAWTPAPAVPGFADAGTRPAIQVRDLAPERVMPECTAPPATPPWRHLLDALVPRITLAHEWALALFTGLLTVLVAWTAAGLRGAGSPPPGLLLVAGGVSLGLSAMHLGRRERAWRAILNVDRSHLSREIVLAGAFVAFGVLFLYLPDPPFAVRLWPVLLGAGALLSVDLVYLPVRVRGGRRWHSAAVLPAAVLLYACLTVWTAAALVLSLLLTGLYLDRKQRRAELGLDARQTLTALRCAAALGAGLTVLFFGEGGRIVAFLLATAGAWIDRVEFYDEMDIDTPESLQLEACAAELESRP